MDHNLQALLAVAISGAFSRGVGLGSAAVGPPFAKRRSPIDRAETVSNRPWRCSVDSLKRNVFNHTFCLSERSVLRSKKFHDRKRRPGAEIVSVERILLALRSNINLSVSVTAGQRELEPCATGFVRVRPQRATMPLED